MRVAQTCPASAKRGKKWGMRTIIMFVLSALLALPLFAEEPAEAETSTSLTTKAWQALGADKPAEAIKHTKRCIELYEKEAVKMQKGLKAPIEGDDDAISAKWALNDVGTCYFIMGQALEKQENNKEAVKAYTALTKKVSFAQCWDPNGWFWSPATASKERLTELKAKMEKASATE